MSIVKSSQDDKRIGRIRDFLLLFYRLWLCVTVVFCNGAVTSNEG